MNEAVTRFREWAERGAAPLTPGVLEALGVLTALFAAALALPAAPPFESAAPEPFDIVTDDEWSAINRATAHFPFQFYSTTYDTHVVPPEPGVVGDIADDIADIYRDVVRGQFLLEHGHMAAAHRHFYETFYVHWGKHITDAIRALFLWLPDRQLEGFWAPLP